MEQLSFVIGPVIAEPLTSPFGLIKIAALSSQKTNTPSALLHSFLCLMITDGTTFFLNSGLPLLTETKIQSPIEAVGSLFKTPEIPTDYDGDPSLGAWVDRQRQ